MQSFELHVESVLPLKIIPKANQPKSSEVFLLMIPEQVSQISKASVLPLVVKRTGPRKMLSDHVHFVNLF